MVRKGKGDRVRNVFGSRLFVSIPNLLMLFRSLGVISKAIIGR